MDTLTRTEFFAKPEVQAALVTVKDAARRALPEASFAQREAAILALFEEASRDLLEQDCRSWRMDLPNICWWAASSTSSTSLGRFAAVLELIEPVAVERSRQLIE